ncbi:MAG: ArsR family transcriptional regulator [Myxococcota bacterium]
MAESDTTPPWESELLVADAIGRLIEFWGFKRHMGRVWTVLYLRGEPMSAKELQEVLALSAGSVSMTVNELMRWSVIKKVYKAGERKDYFVAEGNFWKMISRVFNERERVEILDAIDAMEEALRYVRAKADAGDAAQKERARGQLRRIEQLLELARLGKRLLDALVTRARVDATPLLSILLGQKDA